MSRDVSYTEKPKKERKNQKKLQRFFRHVGGQEVLRSSAPQTSQIFRRQLNKASASASNAPATSGTVNTEDHDELLRAHVEKVCRNASGFIVYRCRSG